MKDSSNENSQKATNFFSNKFKKAKTKSIQFRTSHLNNTSTNDSVVFDRIIYRFKVILLGDIAVGKTSILSRFSEEKYSNEYKCNVGVEFKVKSIYLDEKTGADLQIWDTCGEERFRALTRQYYRNSSGVILIFDLTNKHTFENLSNWLEELKQYGPPGINIMVVGNKCDLIQERSVKFNEANEFCEIFKIPYFEVSAKTGANVSNMFENITSIMVQKESENEAKRKKKNKVDKSHVTANKSITIDKNYYDKYDNKKSKVCCGR